ncbi:hypothetical protein BD626DRAFT_583205 [Schizophyllum amplum]|uniref:Uncharacterized protein n=1 Tax=Schizophyllum amplum TaxID=97359 RepID=A0A550CGK3_9AGAR|nr:hypothetical protein BD626DRAFT_583205 [Auriculariopsis ampla]
MQTLTISTGLRYAYTDSGPPGNSTNYSTLFFIHGYAFYSTGICKRLVAAAPAQDVRLICINRRAYPGSTPFSEDEQRVFRSGADDERLGLLHEEGKNLALLVDALIVDLDLPPRVTILAWSMGNIYLLALLASINYLPHDVASRLISHTTSFILWDPPDEALGYDRPCLYTPFTDDTIPPDQRGPAFIRWLGKYWTHDPAPRDPHRLNAHLPNLYPRPTTDSMPPEELKILTDFAAASTCDNWVVHPTLMHIVATLREEVLCAPEVVEAWRNPDIHYLWTEHGPWMMFWAKWCLEDDLARRYKDALPREKDGLLCGKEDLPRRKADVPHIKFSIMEGCNHFSQWDAPEVTLNAFRRCMR